MKILVIFAILAVTVFYVQAEEFSRENALAIAMACKDEEGATDEDIENFKARLPPVSHEAKCMRACLMGKFGVLIDGQLDKDKAIELAEVIIHDEDKKHLATILVETCESLEFDEDHCEAAGQYLSCMHKYAEEHGIGLDD